MARVDSRVTTTSTNSRTTPWHSLGLSALAVFAVIALALQMAMPAVRAQTAEATASDSLASAVPATSVLFLEADLNQDSEQWQKAYDLTDRSGINDVAEQQAGASTEELGAQADQAQLNGRAAIVFTSAEGLMTSQAVSDMTSEAADVTTDPAAMATGGVPDGFALIVEPDDADALYAEFQSNLTDEANNNNATIQSEDYNGVTIEYWTSDSADVAPTAIAQVDGKVLMAVKPDDLHAVIDTIAGDTPTLSSDENFTSIHDALNQPALMFGYLNAEAIVQAVPESDSVQVPANVSDRAGYVGWNMYADDAGFRMDTVAKRASGGSAADLQTFDPTMATKIGADNLFFLNGTNIAGYGLSDTLGVLLQTALSQSENDMGTPVVPESTPTVDEVYAQLEGQLGFNPKTDLIDQLTGEWAVAGSVTDLASDSPQYDLIFASGVEDPTTVTDTINKIDNIVKSTIDPEEATMGQRDVNGSKITTITINVAPAEEAVATTIGATPEVSTPSAENAMTVVLEYGVVDGQLLVGVNNGIDDYLSGSSTPLADDPVYQQTFAALPSGNVIATEYINLQVLLPQLDELATTINSSSEMLDNDQSCGDYGSQEEAQAAYDADQAGNWQLDMDYDGQACEDFFAPSSPAASPESISSQLNILSIGSVSYVDGDLYRNSSILLIGD